MSGIRGRLPFPLGIAVALVAGWWLFPRVLYERIEQPLQFSHAAHAGDDGMAMACEDCHGFDDDGRWTGIPTTAFCGDCHYDVLGETEAERILVEEYVGAGREIDWLVYARQPDNTHFPHSIHLTLAEIECALCHGDHGATASLRPFERNRVSGYSRDLWGLRMSRLGREPGEGMKMGDCVECHEEREVVESCLDCHR